MTFTMVLICLLVQRWLHINVNKPYFSWFDKYVQFVKRHVKQNSWWDGLGGLVAVLLPLVLAYMLVATVLLAFAGGVIYYLVSLCVLWYYMDASLLSPSVVGKQYPEQLLRDRYRSIFALIFWMVILGPLGVILYAEISRWGSLLSRESNSSEESGLQLKVIQLEGILDWVPMRLLGLTYALLGNFSAIFQTWRQQLFTTVSSSSAALGMMALNFKDGASDTVSEEQRVSIDQLLNRSLLVWLVVFALFTIGRWWS